MKLLLPIRTWNTSNVRWHWAKRAKVAAQQRTVTWMLLTNWAARGGLEHVLTFPLEIRLTRVGPRKCDCDGAIISMKSVRDSIADWLGVDDGDDRLEWVYGKPKLGSFAVEIEFIERGKEAA